MEFVRVFVDSNILISGFVFDGNELRVIFHCLRKGHKLVISEHIEEEVFRTILEKFPEYSKLFHEFIELGVFEIVPKESYIKNIDEFDIVRDGYDRHVLVSAIITGCNMIVSGDKDLLVLGTFKGVRILSARDALKIL